MKRKLEVDTKIINTDTERPITDLDLKQKLDYFGTTCANSGYKIGSKDGLILGLVVGAGIVTVVNLSVIGISKFIKKKSKKTTSEKCSIKI